MYRSRGDRDDEHVTLGPGLFEVNQVADVDEVEGAVTLHDLLAGESLPQSRQIFEGDDLVGDSGRVPDHRWNPAFLASS